MFRFFYISTFKYLKVLQLCKMFQESFIELVKSTKHILLDGPIIKLCTLVAGAHPTTSICSARGGGADSAAVTPLKARGSEKFIMTTIKIK